MDICGLDLHPLLQAGLAAVDPMEQQLAAARLEGMHIGKLARRHGGWRAIPSPCRTRRRRAGRWSPARCVQIPAAAAAPARSSPRRGRFCPAAGAWPRRAEHAARPSARNPKLRLVNISILSSWRREPAERRDDRQTIDVYREAREKLGHDAHAPAPPAKRLARLRGLGAAVELHPRGAGAARDGPRSATRSNSSRRRSARACSAGCRT